MIVKRGKMRLAPEDRELFRNTYNSAWKALNHDIEKARGERVALKEEAPRTKRQALDMIDRMLGELREKEEEIRKKPEIYYEFYQSNPAMVERIHDQTRRLIDYLERAKLAIGKNKRHVE